MPIHLKNDELFTTREAATYLGFAEDTIRRYIYRKLIAGEKFNNAIVVRKSECDRYRREKLPRGRQKKISK